MKKIIMTLAIIGTLSTVTYTADNVVNSLNDIESEFKLLEQKEKEKFKDEEKKNQISQQKYNNYILMINKTNEKIKTLSVNEKTSFFPQEQKNILNSYKEIEKKLRISANEEQKKIEEFNQLKNALGY